MLADILDAVADRLQSRAGSYPSSRKGIARLFSVIPSIHDRATFRVAYHAGPRASGLGMIDLRDYDARSDRIFTHCLKGSHSGHHHLMREEGRPTS